MSLLADLRCVRCASPLDAGAVEIACAGCGQAYPRVGRIPVVLPRPEAHVELWRRQLALVVEQGRHTERQLVEEAEGAGGLDGARARLRAMAAAVRAQVDDLAAAVSPALGGPLPVPRDAGVGLPRGVVEYGHYLYRDWGWPPAVGDENARSLAALRGVMSAGPLGRVLVVGAGACRSPAELHRARGATQTVVVDIDPFLFVVAEAVVRGGAVPVTEAGVNAFDAEHVQARWTLRAPAGPLAEARFPFLFANGLAPPFADAAFDAVFTPWFIDRVPPDVPAFLAEVRRLLRPGGRWLNQGPLAYAAETPLRRRHGRDELFALAERAGLRVGRSTVETRPYLVSPLTGGGKMERILTFEALAAS
jgi:SAM-dependent methyltransferase